MKRLLKYGFIGTSIIGASLITTAKYRIME